MRRGARSRDDNLAAIAAGVAVAGRNDGNPALGGGAVAGGGSDAGPAGGEDGELGSANHGEKVALSLEPA